MARSIQQIDKDITANRKLLLRRRPVRNQLSAADWHAAWDAEPALKAADHALWVERGNAQLERDRLAYEAAVRGARVIKAIKRRPARRCPSCNALVAA